MSKGYDQLPDLERRMEQGYAGFLERRSLRFHLAYAAGFESMALAVKSLTSARELGRSQGG